MAGRGWRTNGADLKRPHRQTWIKVNAPVDVAISDLVSTLNAFPRLQTIESCQGSANVSAWICFCYGEHWRHPWQELVDFVFGYLGPGLARQIGDAASVMVRVTESGRVQGELTVRPDAIDVTTKALKRLLRNFNP